MQVSRWQYAFLLALATTASRAEVKRDDLDQGPVELDPIVVVASKTERLELDINQTSSIQSSSHDLASENYREI